MREIKKVYINNRGERGRGKRARELNKSCMQLFGRKRKRMLRHGKAFVAQNMEGSKKKDGKKKTKRRIQMFYCAHRQVA